MRVPFRQGIVSAPDNFLGLSSGTVDLAIPSGEYLTVTFADGTADYLLTETASVSSAWTGPFTNGTSYWLYWDINTSTGAKTYGFTDIKPQVGATTPLNTIDQDGTAVPLLNSQMWFNTSKGVMYEYNAEASRWIRKVRCLAAELHQGNNLISTSANSPVYTGTQVGMNVGCTAGSLVFDATSHVIRKHNGTFYTTEDAVSTGIGNSTHVKLESIAITAVATANMAAYTMVRLIDFNQIAPATNLLTDAGIYGLIEQDVNVGDSVTIVREGVVTNPSWDWSSGSVNAPLFVQPDGVLTTQPQPSQPVGLVISSDSILLTATIVDNISLIRAGVTIVGPDSGVEVTGTTGDFSEAFTIALTNDLAAVEALGTTGVVHRTGDGEWSAENVRLTSEVSGTLPTANGGTGSNGLVAGFVQSAGSGAPLFSSPTIQGSVISGDIAGNAAGVTGVVPVYRGGTGGINQTEAINALTPPQSASTAGKALVSNGTDVNWETVANGTVTHVGVASTSPGVAVSGSPIVSSGDITISLTGKLQSIDQLVTSGFVSITPDGSAITHNVASSSGTVTIGNGTGAAATDLDINLPAVNTHGHYVDVIADQYGRVVWGSPTLNWSKVVSTPLTIAGYGIGDAYTKTETDAKTWNWSAITALPYTIDGFGIVDAYTKTEVDALVWNWSSIANTPGTLAGYGITDGVKNAGGASSISVGASINKPAAGVSGRIYIDTTTNLFSYDNGGAWVTVGGTGSVTSVTVAAPGDGLSVTNPTVTTSGTIAITLADDLAAVEGLSTTGLIVRTGTNAWSSREIVGDPGSITVTNGDGVGGDITLGLPAIATPGSYYNVTVDATGRVTSGSTSFVVDWDSITNKPTSVSGYAITDAVTVATVNQANGVCGLDNTGKIPQANLPAIAITDVFVCADQVTQLALAAQPGDVAIRTDENKTYILRGGVASTMSNWSQILSPAAAGGGGGVTYVQATSSNPDLIISGGPILDVGTLTFDITGNLGRASALSPTASGILRVGPSWSTGNVSLTTEVDGVLPVPSGGTGAASLTGYVKGNGTSAFTAVAKIPVADIDGAIAADASTLTGVVSIANGGTGQSTRSAAINSLLPLQTVGVLVSDGTDPSWTTAIPSNYIVGAVPLATTATTASDSLALGGVAANEFVTSLGNNATGTWNISVSGNAATATNASQLNGMPASQFASATGGNVSGNWNINSVNVTGVVAIANGGTGATTAATAINAILPAQAGNAGKMLSTDGTEASWQVVDLNTVASRYIADIINVVDADAVASASMLGALVRMNSTAAHTFTISLDSVVNIPERGVITVRGVGIGAVTIVGEAGVTINTPGTLNLRARHSTVQLIKVGPNEWDIIGDIEL